jgi:hypothetical protein
MTNPKSLTPEDLNRFTGSAHWYRHWCNRKVTYTDGAKFVADTAGAHWLLDEIAIIQPYEQAVAAQEFQVWTLRVHPDRSAVLSCEDGDGAVVYTKDISCTDFPLDEITLWFSNDVIYLPNEH